MVCAYVADELPSCNFCNPAINQRCKHPEGYFVGYNTCDDAPGSYLITVDRYTNCDELCTCDPGLFQVEAHNFPNGLPYLLVTRLICRR